MSWFGRKSRRDDDQNAMTRLVSKIIAGSPSMADAQALAAYGAACIDPLVRASIGIIGGEAADARDYVFRHVEASSAFPILRALLRDNDQRVRRVSAEGLRCLKLDDQEQLRGEVIDALLIAMIDESDVSTYEAMAYACVAPKDMRAAYPLFTMAKRNEPDVAKHAAQALSWLLEEKHLIQMPLLSYEYRKGEGLVKKRSYDDDIRRHQLYMVVDEAARNRDIALLSRYLQANWEYCELTVDRIRDEKIYGDPLDAFELVFELVEPLLHTLLIPGVGYQAAHALKHIKTPRKIPSLIWLLKYCRPASSLVGLTLAEEVLAPIGQPAVAPIVAAIRAMYHQHFTYLEASQRWRPLLPQFLNTRAMFPAISIVSDGMNHLSYALKHVEDVNARDELLQLVNDPLELIREAAEKALENMR